MDSIDPDKLILGLTAYMSADESDKNPYYPIYDFFARYVRKIHPDRHIKKTLTTNPGKSFLEMIGSSDIAYIVMILKNSKTVWLHDNLT